MKLVKKLAASALICALTLAFASASQAQTKWNITKLNPDEYPEEIVLETRTEANAGLVDGLIATFDGGDITAAWYSKPTKRYNHAILGDEIEAGQLNVTTSKNRTLKFILPKTQVFEDQTPRLADLDGDGTVEVITIRSSVAKGASVTVYGLRNSRLLEKATTGFYGRKNRWLNIAGIERFIGFDGKEIAFVETPHIGGNLFFYSYLDGNLIKRSAASNFSNHEIGSREMRLSAVADVNSDGLVDLALPSADRTKLRVMGFRSGKLRNIAIASLPARINKAILAQSEGKKGFVVGLEDGSVYLVHP